MRKLIVVLFVAFMGFVGINSFAVPTASAAIASGCDNRASFLLFPPWYAYLDVGAKGDDPCAIIGPTNPTNGEFSFELALPRIGLAVTEILLRIAGMVTVGFIIYGGFRYITSQGEPDALKQAQGTIINALIGMTITILAVTIVSFIGNTLW
jgi:hypothetical protein